MRKPEVWELAARDRANNEASVMIQLMLDTTTHKKHPGIILLATEYPGPNTANAPDVTAAMRQRIYQDLPEFREGQMIRVQDDDQKPARTIISKIVYPEDAAKAKEQYRALLKRITQRRREWEKTYQDLCFAGTVAPGTPGAQVSLAGQIAKNRSAGHSVN